MKLFRRFSARKETSPIMLGGARRAELRDHQKDLHNFQLRLADGREAGAWKFSAETCRSGSPRGRPANGWPAI